jgi:DNA topoisomerase-1
VKRSKPSIVRESDTEDSEDTPIIPPLRKQPIEIVAVTKELGIKGEPGSIPNHSNGKRLAIKRELETKSYFENSDSEEETLAKIITKKQKRPIDTKSKPVTPSVKTNKLSVKNEPGALRKGSKRDANGATRGTTKVKDEEGDENEYKWWLEENPLGDGSVKWTTLEHNGVYFPPPYQPHGIQMKYDGRPLKLGPDAEEVATFFAGVVGTQHAENETFVKNFFEDFLAVLRKKETNCVIKDFRKCDFTPIVQYLEAEKDKKKNLTKAEKDQIKQEKQAIDDRYGWAMIDGRKEKVGNFRVEPPGLFRGRGAHPKAGKLKVRVRPEDIIINIGGTSKAPTPPAGHKWKQVVHDNTVTWLASWTENVNGQVKYVFLAANSSWKGMSDFKKFEKARTLKKHVNRIRKEYLAMLKDREMVKRQLATAMYFIDKLALRAGNEKGEDEADTVGCCSLRFEHVSLQDENVVVFDFLGKDSIRYYNEVTVDPQVHKNLKLFKKGHQDGDDLFDRIDTTVLNKHLQSFMPGLTAKVFRTYNASITFQQELAKTPSDGSVHDKVLAYNRANRQVAVLCNHQRAVPKTFTDQMSKLNFKVRGFKFERDQIKKSMLKLDPKLKKRSPELVSPESDIDDEFIREYTKQEDEKERERQNKQLEKMNEERKLTGEKPLKLKDLPGKSTRELSIEQLEKKLAQITSRIDAAKMQMIDKDENKTTALGTSKINYIDPRISAAWCYKYDVPVEKMFPKALREKFKWAMDVDSEWKF